MENENQKNEESEKNNLSFKDLPSNTALIIIACLCFTNCTLKEYFIHEEKLKKIECQQSQNKDAP